MKGTFMKLINFILNACNATLQFHHFPGRLDTCCFYQYFNVNQYHLHKQVSVLHVKQLLQKTMDKSKDNVIQNLHIWKANEKELSLQYEYLKKMSTFFF